MYSASLEFSLALVSNPNPCLSSDTYVLAFSVCFQHGPDYLDQGSILFLMQFSIKRELVYERDSSKVKSVCSHSGSQSVGHETPNRSFGFTESPRSMGSLRPRRFVVQATKRTRRAGMCHWKSRCFAAVLPIMQRHGAQKSATIRLHRRWPILIFKSSSCLDHGG